MTTTPFALLCQFDGLSQREAAELLDVRLDTVKSWAAGRNRTPPDVLDELASLAERIETVAAAAITEIGRAAAAIGEGAPEPVELGLAADDAEAQSLGWPCVGAQRACLARVVARGTAAGYRFRIVPRGTTATTAGAADAHRK